MCGIFGAINMKRFFDGAALAHLSNLNNVTSYRGPDDHGVRALKLKHQEGDLASTQNDWNVSRKSESLTALSFGRKSAQDDSSFWPHRNSENTSGDCFDVFLGNRRLSIIDLSSNGHQPMTDHQGRWIVYNGEIFNYLELRRELQAKGHEFRTGTDTEVIFHVYSEYGEQGFDRFNGMWAFAIADVPKRRVVLSRDRFSIKPLYFLRFTAVYYFASEIKQLLPLLPMRRLNAETCRHSRARPARSFSRDLFRRHLKQRRGRTSLLLLIPGI